MSTQTTVGTLPNCDLCAQKGKTTTARYDAALTLGPWAYVCEKHFAQYGQGLGTGRGQELVAV